MVINVVGIDSTDPNGFDDIVVQEITLASWKSSYFLK